MQPQAWGKPHAEIHSAPHWVWPCPTLRVAPLHQSQLWDGIWEPAWKEPGTLMPTRAYGREGEAEVGPQDLARKGKSKYKDMALSLQDSTSLGKSFRSGGRPGKPQKEWQIPSHRQRWSLVRCRTDNCWEPPCRGPSSWGTVQESALQHPQRSTVASTTQKLWKLRN